jgi:hypothetical protein
MKYERFGQIGMLTDHQKGWTALVIGALLLIFNEIGNYKGTISSFEKSYTSSFDYSRYEEPVRFHLRILIMRLVCLCLILYGIKWLGFAKLSFLPTL